MLASDKKLRRKNSKKHNKVLARLSVVLIASTGILFIGSTAWVQSSQDIVAEAHENKANNTGADKARHDSELIAVVNSDEGIKENGGLIVYADKLVTLPDTEHYEFATLSEAKAGIEDGTYGGYVVIPGDFSKSVASLNDTPQACELDYAIDREADATKQYMALHSIYNFGTKLNNDISYMYVNNIMTEFHKAQDAAGSVMSNDIRDKEAIEAISANDLVALVEVPEMKQAENNITPLDVSTYVSNTDSILKGIEDEYQAGITDVNGKLAAIQGSGTELSDNLMNISGNASNVDAIENIDEADAVKTAKDNVSKAITEDKAGTDAANNSISGVNTDVNSLVDKINDSLNRSLDTSNGELDQISATIKDIDATLNVTSNQDGTVSIGYNGGPAVKLEVEENEDTRIDDLRAAFSAITSKLAQAVNEQTEVTESVNYDTTSKVTVTNAVKNNNETVYVVSYDGNGNLVTDDSGKPIVTQRTFTSYTVTDEEKEIPVSGKTDVIVNAAKSVQDVFDELSKDEAITNALEENGYQDVASFMAAVSADPSILEHTHHVAVASSEKEINDFNSYISSKLQDAGSKVTNAKYHEIDVKTMGLYDQGGNKLPECTINTALIKILNLTSSGENSIQEMLTKNLAARTESYNTTTANLFNSVNDQVAITNTEIDTAKSALEEDYGKGNDAVKGYNEKIAENTPTFTGDAAAQSIKLRTQATDMQDEVLKNNKSYIDYADEVFKTSTENVDNLRQNISDTKEASDKAVSDGLSNARSVKEETSSANQSMMKNFADKLPNTRIGSLENTSAYQFIVSPLNAVDVSADAKEVLADQAKVPSAGNAQPETSETAVTAAQNNAGIVHILALIILSAGVVGLIIFFVIRFKSRRDNQSR